MTMFVSGGTTRLPPAPLDGLREARGVRVIDRQAVAMMLDARTAPRRR